MSNLYEVFDDTEQRNTETIAALDIGSNSFHLVVARVVADSVQVLTRVKHKVRLADGLNEQSILSDEAMQRGLDTLESMVESLKGVSVDSVRIVATHTLRRARNADAFLQKARSVFPFPIEVISGAEEARLIYVGVFNHTNVKGSRLIIDIGGGSTEFAIGKDPAPQLCKSLRMGCVSYQKRFFADGTITLKAVERAITAAEQDLELASVSLKECSWEHSIGSSGTAKAIAAVANPNEDGQILPFSQQDLQLLVARCIEKGHSDKLDFEGLSEDRKPVFVSGLCIMLAIFQSLKLQKVVISQAALREGVLTELKGEQTSQDVRVRTAQSLATRYDVDTPHAHKVLKSCMFIYNEVKHDWQLSASKFRFMIAWSALLHEIGLQVNSRGLQKHSAYILSNSDLPGYNQDQQRVMAALVRFHRKKILREQLPNSIEYTERCIAKMLTILRLGILLNISRQASNTRLTGCFADENSITIKFADNVLSSNRLLLADLQKEVIYLDNIDIILNAT